MHSSTCAGHELVEVIRGLATSDETYATVKAPAEKLEKTPVEVNDRSGIRLQPAC